MLPLGGFFQLGYVTTDLEAAIEVYAKRFGAGDFLTMDTAKMNAGARYTSFVGLAWIGDVQVELIQPKDVNTPLYVDAMPKNGFGINFHHAGYLVDSEAAWRGVEDQLAAQAIPITSRSLVPDRMDIIYADARPIFGHYLEYVWARGEGLAFLQNVPRNAVKHSA